MDYKNLNASIFSVLKVSEISGIPVLLLSNPGIGKTTTVYMFAKQRGYKVVELRGNSTTAEEVNGYDVAPKDVTFDRPTAACHLRPSWFEEVLKNKDNGEKTLLFLDEITTANEFVQAALLKLIFDRACGRESLPDDTLIVSAGNYSSNLTTSMSLLPPVMNRFILFNILPSSNDLDIFLNKYKGSALGRKEDYMENISKVIAEMDKNQKTVNADTKDKIGELFESAILRTCKMLTSNSSEDSGIDLTITDLQGIYNGLSDDPRVYGFISFRTLTYLREVAIAWYLCFGKEGINGEDFRAAIDGLCGVGLRRVTQKQQQQNNRRGYDNNDAYDDSEVVTVHVGEYFYNALRNSANECEKLGNDLFAEYAGFFNDWVKRIESVTESKNMPSIVPELNAAVEKISELLKVRELQYLERPIDETSIRNILLLVSKSSRAKVDALRVEASNNMSAIDDGTVLPSDQAYPGVVTELNAATTLFEQISGLIKDPARGYSESIIATYNDISQRDMSAAAKSIRVLIKFIKRRNKELAGAIPELKTLRR